MLRGAATAAVAYLGRMPGQHATTPLRANSWRDPQLYVPPVALVVLAGAWGRHPHGIALIAVIGVLVAAVLSSVHHAEVIAHRVGEPFGTLILALAVTVIEGGLIVTLMASHPESSQALARDTVFAAVMIVCNGVVGLCLVVGALRHRVVAFRAEGTSGAFAALLTLCVLSLVLPTFTTSTPGPTFSGPQLTFAAVGSLVLYVVFVLTQTVQHREYFLPVETPSTSSAAAPEPADHGDATAAVRSAVLLPFGLIAVVGLAKTLSPAIEDGVEAIDAPNSLVGVVIALVVLLPETIAAVRAATRNRLQTSMNLALGSGLASIGLTIPTIAVASIWLDGPVVLGLDGKEIVLLTVTAAVGILTLVHGQAIVLQGAIHLVIFGAFLVLAVRP